MARAETYGDIARLEQLLDEHANIAAMDPAKLPAVRGEIWQLMHAAEMHRDLGLDERPDDEEFDDFLLHVDGWLCEIKDAQIRDGLHVLGQAPEGEARVNLVLAILRAAQVWGGESAAVPGLRAALGLKEGDEATGAVDEVEQQARDLVLAHGGRPAGTRRRGRGPARRPRGAAGARLRRRAGGAPPGPHHRRARRRPARPRRRLRPGRARRAPRCAGWSTCCRPGATSTPSTRAPCRRRLAWQTGVGDGRLAAPAPPRRHRRLPDLGRPLGVGHLRDAHLRRRRRRGARAARRAPRLGRGLAPGLATCRSSRSRSWAARASTSRCGSPASSATPSRTSWRCSTTPCSSSPTSTSRPEQNFVRAHVADRPRRARRPTAGPPPGSSAPSPGSYGAGILQVVESGTWRDDDDLAEVYTAWGGFAYGRDLDGAPAADDMRTNYRRIKVAAKNIDTREHDIADSDDYFQYHGGMIATVRALTGVRPEGLRRRLDHARRRPHPHPAGGDQPGLPGPRGQPALDRRHAAPRLQGRLRAGRHRRLPLRLRRHRRGRARLDVRVAGPRVRARRDQPGVHAPLQPVGAARHRGEAARGRRPRAVGGARTPTRWPRCRRSTSTSRATSRTGPVAEAVVGSMGGARRVVVWGSAWGPQHVTVEAAAAIGSVDVVLAFAKGRRRPAARGAPRGLRDATASPLVVRRRPAARRATTTVDYDGRRRGVARGAGGGLGGRARRAPPGTSGSWSGATRALYDSTMRLLDRLQTGPGRPLVVEVVPGISSLSAAGRPAPCRAARRRRRAARDHRPSAARGPRRGAAQPSS